jgi:hypothetical protein
VTISEIAPLQLPLATIQRLREHSDDQRVIIGGVAAGVLGTARLTVIESRLPTPEDLMILKSVAHRPKDLPDITEIASRHPDLDGAGIER